MYLLNASTSKIAVLLGERKILLRKKDHIVIKGENPATSVSVKLATPKEKDPDKWDLAFSSTWRISHLRREFCILYEKRGRISLKVIQARGVVATPAQRSGREQ